MSGCLGMMLSAGGSDLVLVGVSAVASSTSGTLAINKPSGVSAGDLMIAVMSSAGDQTWSGDTGWSEIADLGEPSGLRLAQKLAGGSEGSSYSFSASGGSGDLSGVIVAYRNAELDVTGAFIEASSGAAIEAPSVTMSEVGILIAAYAIDQASRTFTTPSGMLPLVSDSNASAPSFAVFSQALGAGATGTKSSTPSGGGNSAGILIGIKGA